MNTKLKNIWFTVGIVVPIITTVYGLNQHLESSKQFQQDMGLEAKESLLEDEYWNIISDYNDERLSKDQSISKLKNLYLKFENLKKDGYRNDWDHSSSERFFFQSIDLHMKFIQQKLIELEKQ